MLRERLELIEREIITAKAHAGYLYLQIVSDRCNESAILDEYDAARSRLVNLQTDAAIIKELISEGMQ